MTHQGMTFFDSAYNESIVKHVISVIIDLDARKDTDNLRNIIFCYNPNNDTYGSQHGMDLHKSCRAKDSSAFADNKVTSYMTEVSSRDERTDLNASNKMSFFKEESHSKVRVYIDEYMVHVLDILFIVSTNTVDFRYIIDMMINEWMDDISKHTVRSANDYGSSSIKHAVYGYKKCSYYWFPVNGNIWDKLKYISRTKGLKVSDAFIQAIVMFINKRYEVVKSIDKQCVTV